MGPLRENGATGLEDQRKLASSARDSRNHSVARKGSREAARQAPEILPEGRVCQLRDFESAAVAHGRPKRSQDRHLR